MSDDEKEVRWVKKGSKNQFTFNKALEILGLKEQYAQQAIKEAELEEAKKNLTKPIKLDNGVEIRLS